MFQLRSANHHTIMVLSKRLEGMFYFDNVSLTYIMRLCRDEQASLVTAYAALRHLDGFFHPHQDKLKDTYIVPVITVEGEPLKTVDKFAYLGSTLSRSMKTDDEVETRIAKASSVCIKPSYCQPYCTHVRHGRFTNATRRIYTASTWNVCESC